MTVTRAGADLAYDWFANFSHQLAGVQFSDTIVSRDTLTELGLTAHGTEGSDILTAVDGYTNRLLGDGGYDHLIGGTGDDQLVGYGLLEGGDGNDTYVFDPDNINLSLSMLLDSGGTDTIDFGALALEDAQFYQDGNDLVVTTPAGSVTIQDQMVAPVVEFMLFNGQHYDASLAAALI